MSQDGKDATLPAGVRERILAIFDGGRIVAAEPLTPPPRAGPDRAAGETAKAMGYGAPIRVDLVDAIGVGRSVVFRTATANDFGHDRRSDRAEEQLLLFDAAARIPHHVAALDVGAIGADGRLISLGDAGEFYLITEFGTGTLYADDLRRISRDAHATPLDESRVRALARYLVSLHAEKGKHAAVYTRAVRDLVGHGEGIFGLIDAYGPDTPAAPPKRLQAIEARAVEWRWKLRGRERRLARTHGDFHPFNVLFGADTTFTLLDTSRGSQGDPADDVTCMAINYVFFALDRPTSWTAAFGRMWRDFFGTYLEASGDAELLDVAAPWLAWRALVIANPRFYPAMSAGARDRILTLAERVLDSPRLDLSAPENLWR